MSNFVNAESLSVGNIVRVYDTWDDRRENWMLGESHRIVDARKIWDQGRAMITLAYADGAADTLYADEEVYLEA